MPPVIALSTGSLYTYGTSRTARMAADAGFDGLEVMVDERWDTRDPVYLATVSRDVTLPIVSVHAPSRGGLAGWGADVDRARHSVELARAVGARTVVVHPPLRYRWITFRRMPFLSVMLLTPLPRRSRYRAWLETEAAACGAVAGVTVAVENMPRHPLVGRWSVSLFELGALRDLGRVPAVTFDTTHLGTWGVDLLEAYESVWDRVALVHLSDYDGEQHRLPGEGRLPLGPLLGALKRRGFGGAITVELVPEVLGAGDDRLVASRLRAACQFCRENFR